MKNCDKCKCELEPNTQGINHQSIEMYDKKYDLCNGCCTEVVCFITAKNPSEMDEELFD